MCYNWKLSRYVIKPPVNLTQDMQVAYAWVQILSSSCFQKGTDELNQIRDDFTTSTDTGIQTYTVDRADSIAQCQIENKSTFTVPYAYATLHLYTCTCDLDVNMYK